MSRLIDADVFKKYITNGLEKNKDDILEEYQELARVMTREFLKDIDEQPTAFDIDWVVERLENESFWTFSTFDEDGFCNDDSEEVIYLGDAIEIVKAGGI